MEAKLNIDDLYQWREDKKEECNADLSNTSYTLNVSLSQIEDPEDSLKEIPALYLEIASGETDKNENPIHYIGTYLTKEKALFLADILKAIAKTIK